MPELFKPQTENLYRGLIGGVELREGADGDMGGSGQVDVQDTTLVGHFCVFNEWTEISSWYEGEFLERIAPGAAKKTIQENVDQVKVQYDHGHDEWVCSSLLGPIDVLREDEVGVYYEVPLLDTDYNRDRVLPMLQGRLMSGESRGSLLGASFRMRVVKDAWDMEPKPSTYNPKGLPERTITEFRLFEFGPVPFPAYPTATAMTSAGMRSLTDHYLDRLKEKRSAKPAGAGTSTPAQPPAEPLPEHSRDKQANGRSLAAAQTTLLKLRSTP